MSRHIFFACNPNCGINAGDTKIEEDNSFVFEPSPKISAFSIYLFNWTVEITTKQLSPCEYVLQYVMGYFDKEHYISKSIQLPKARRGSVSVQIDFPCGDGIYYNEYTKFVCSKYYDPEKRILAFGDLEAAGMCIEFAKNQYVVINNMGVLKSLYIALS